MHPYSCDSKDECWTALLFGRSAYTTMTEIVSRIPIIPKYMHINSVLHLLT